MRKGHARSPTRALAALAPRDAAAAERRLLRVVGTASAEAARRAGEWLVCARGCAECCHGPFPVTRLDARRLCRGLARLAETAPDRARAVQRRARDAVERLAVDFPGDATTGQVVQDEARLDAFLARHAELPCPALDPATRACDLYEHRPVPCRSFGPPLRYGDVDAPHCALCFTGAPAELIEHCRVEPDPDDLEHAILRAAGVPGDETWETLIAFALLRG